MHQKQQIVFFFNVLSLLEIFLFSVTIATVRGLFQ